MPKTVTSSSPCYEPALNSYHNYAKSRLEIFGLYNAAFYNDKVYEQCGIDWLVNKG